MSKNTEQSRIPYNKGRLIGPKPSLKPKHVVEASAFGFLRRSDGRCPVVPSTGCASPARDCPCASASPKSIGQRVNVGDGVDLSCQHLIERRPLLATTSGHRPT